MHRVFPSSRRISASARRVQVHRGQEGDSGEVVTPFMHVGTYPTRNFATLGPSELRPPFTGASGRSLHPLPSPSGTGQVSVPILPLTSLQRPVFLGNSRSPLFSDASIKQFLTRWGTPSPEVTEPICRVPSSCFARAPGFIQPVHLCRIEVRSLALLMCFLERLRCHQRPRTPPEHLNRSSSCLAKGIPIRKGYRQSLRGRLTRTPPIVASKPVDFRRSGFGPDMSLLMPAESAPAPRHYLSTMPD